MSQSFDGVPQCMRWVAMSGYYPPGNCQPFGVSRIDTMVRYGSKPGPCRAPCPAWNLGALIQRPEQTSILCFGSVARADFPVPALGLKVRTQVDEGVDMDVVVWVDKFVVGVKARACSSATVAPGSGGQIEWQPQTSITKGSSPKQYALDDTVASAGDHNPQQQQQHEAVPLHVAKKP